MTTNQSTPIAVKSWVNDQLIKSGVRHQVESGDMIWFREYLIWVIARFPATVWNCDHYPEAEYEKQFHVMARSHRNAAHVSKAAAARMLQSNTDYVKRALFQRPIFHCQTVIDAGRNFFGVPIVDVEWTEL